MCVGQPLRFASEVEASWNRLYFPIVKVGEASHRIVFSDPNGRIYTCGIPPGRYTPQSACAHLSSAMTSAVHQVDETVEYCVRRTDDDRFAFECKVSGSPAVFSILFHHPLSVDAGRFGFPAQPLAGRDSYVAPTPTHMPERMCNVLRVSEVAAQCKFRFHATMHPPMIAVVTSRRGSSGVVCVKTYVNRQPFAHGLHDGHVVQICNCGDATVVSPQKDDDGDAGETTVAATAAAIPSGCSCIVENDGDVSDPTLLTLRVPALRGLSDEGTCFQITTPSPEPWNMCLCRPGTIPAHVMGFPERSIQCDVDGSVADARGGALSPPVDAPFAHNLDHPDYVLLTFSEGSGAALEHSYGGENKHVFCKLSLYPLFREERMLPRDTVLLGTNLATFTISFWNPDMRTPYHFHGRHFSLSLNFFSSVPDA